MSENEKSAIESLADALWSRAAKSASATFRHAIDDLAGIDATNDGYGSRGESTDQSSSDQRNRRLDDETLEDLTIAARRALDFADRKYRAIVDEFVGEAGSEDSPASELKRLAERAIQSFVDADYQGDTTDSSSHNERARQVANWFADIVSDQTLGKGRGVSESDSGRTSEPTSARDEAPVDEGYDEGNTTE